MSLDKDLKDRLIEGKKYELLTADHYKRMGYVLEDKSLDKAFWHKGDLCLCDDYIGLEYMVEVKDDNIIGKTGNVLLELATIRDGKRSEGWFWRPYDRMAYIDSRNRIAYMLDYQKMRREINIDDLTRRTINNDNGNQGEVVLVNLKDIAAHGWIYDRWNYTDGEWERIEKIYENYDKQNPGWLGLADRGAA